MTSAEIRRSFLEFFQEKQHTLVPSSSLLPDSPNLLFTNAGMNQFVPIFLGQVPCPYTPGRAADTQKCIRAGGKHNDLEDVGLDTYHHTFFEMLGNWSFGDYFKKEAIAWAWELLVDRWKLPPQRLYATIYQPDKAAGDPAERDEEAWNFWAEKFRAAGLDPDVHIVDGNKKDNFWMMGDTGPCGPCSELHIDLTPAGDTRGALVNKGTAECIEIWNLVFIQFNANPDGTFSPLPAQHIDTGMGFERVTSILQCTKGFTDFTHARISNYETDIFRPIFDEIEKLGGKTYGSTLPDSGGTGGTEQEKVDVAFRVIADHIRTLSFAIADGIQPGNSDRNYVLRRILRRAVRYGRTLGFKEPFFYKLVDVVARTMGDAFPEIRAKQKHVEEVLKREEEAFNKTLDKGIELFNQEVTHLYEEHGEHGERGERGHPGRISGPPARVGDTHYRKRRLPHYERPHGIYHVSFSTREHRILDPVSRTIVRDSVIFFDQKRYTLFAVCVMPDHVHILFQPWIRGDDDDGKPVFWPLKDLMHSIKSYSANKINEHEHREGTQVWENEYHDRLMRSDSDVEEKFLYVCRNPWEGRVVGDGEEYEWLWTWSDRQDAGHGGQDGRAPRAPRAPRASHTSRTPRISGAFAFRLYDEQGFPLDLTELMARERGLEVDVDGFEKLMDEQRRRARAAQKKTVIELSEIQTKEPTHFLGYDHDHTGADVREVVVLKGRTAVVLNNSVCYAEMGGQVGDSGRLMGSGKFWRVTDTQKSGGTWLHFIEESDAPALGDHLTVEFDPARRAAIQRHHTVTHLLHWALHEVVSRDAVQKGSYVGPDKLTFDFSGNALTPAQIAEVENLVNAKIMENAPVFWSEVPHADVRDRADVMQFFGDKYGDLVRVVQVGGAAGSLDGFSMELCGGTHVRHTGEIGLFRIQSEGAVAAGIRRIEAVAGVEALQAAFADREKIRLFAEKLNSPTVDLEKKLDVLFSRQKELEKALKSSRQREAAARAAELFALRETAGTIPVIVANLGEADGDSLQASADALKSKFNGVVVLGGAASGAVSLVAVVGREYTARISAGKIIQTIAPLVGGRGGGRPDAARGGGGKPENLDAALAAAREFVARA